jgi:hypothetical protein
MEEGMKHRFFDGMWWTADRTNTQLGVPEHSGFWFRVFGYGLHVSTKKRKDALFSERYGFRKVLYLFGLRFEALKA